MSNSQVNVQLQREDSMVFQRMKDIEMHHDFWHPGTPHVVGVGLEVHYVNNIRTLDQTFQAGFYLSLEWQPSEHDIVQFKNLKREGREHEFEPEYVPHIHFPNVLQFEQRDWETHLDGSVYSFVERGKPDTRGAIIHMEVDCMLTATLNVRATFGEPFELERFPYDVQDLKIILSSTATSNTQILVPHFERNAFAKINMNVSSLPDWHFDRAVAEFDLSDPEESLWRLQFSTCTLNLKVARRFRSYIPRVMFMMAIISVTMFTTFSLDPIADAADRQANGFGLLLTALVFMFVVANQLPNVPYLTILDRYIYTLFMLMFSMGVWSAIVNHLDDARTMDLYAFFIFGVTWVSVLLFFALYGCYARWQENKKLKFTSEDYSGNAEESMTIDSEEIREPHHNYWSHGAHQTKHDGSKTPRTPKELCAIAHTMDDDGTMVVKNVSAKNVFFPSNNTMHRDVSTGSAFVATPRRNNTSPVSRGRHGIQKNISGGARKHYSGGLGKTASSGLGFNLGGLGRR